MPELECFLDAIAQRRREIPAERALLVGISGIDGSGKGFVAAQVAKSLSKAGNFSPGYNLAVVGADAWLNLPHIRFAEENGAQHFYDSAFRSDEMFERLILPLRDHREVDLEMAFTEETATAHRRHRYHFREVDIVLVEGIFLFKREYRSLFDLTCWIECSFETALARAVKRRQEGLPPKETIRAFETIYFPAQRIHLHRDNPRAAADMLLPNDTDEIISTPGQEKALVTSNLLSKP